MNVAFPAWPLPQWTESRLAELRADAHAAEHDPFMALLAAAKLLAAQGKLAEAHALLRSGEPRFAAATVPNGMFRNLLSTAIMVHAADLARVWLSNRFKLHYAIDIDVIPSDAPIDVVHLTVRDNAARFVFPAALLISRACESTLNRWVDVFPLCDAFMNSPHRVDGEVDINLGDGCARPGLAFCANRPGYFLIPDASYMDASGYRSTRARLQQNPVNWEDRQPIAIWRGATTGHPANPAVGWRSLPRIRLCEIGQAHPDVIDAGITSVGQIDDAGARTWLQSRNLLREHVPADRFQRYRYQIDIDGNTNSWPGLFVKLLTGTPVLKVASPGGYRQWYYDRLRAWINYIPVAASMDDLVEKIGWLREHDDVARKVGEAGRALAEALDYDQEIVRAAPVFAAAIRTASGAAMIDLSFAAGAPENAALHSGWQSPAADGVNAEGCEARLTLPKPIDGGDCLLIAELSPAAAPPQRVSIIGNGELLAQATITERTTVYGPLSRFVASAGDNLQLTFALPDCQREATQSNPLDERAGSVTLHRIRVAAAHCYTGDELPDIAAPLTALHAGNAASAVHDLWWWHGRALPEGAVPRSLHTSFGTILYADVAAGRIRHGPETQVPRNLFLVRRSDTASLVRTGGNGDYFGVRIRPQGLREAAGADEFVQAFDLVAAPGQQSESFGLRGGGLLACAEPNGEFTLSRDVLGPWEQFSCHSDGPGEQHERNQDVA